MTAFTASDRVAITSDQRVLRAAVAAYLGRYRGPMRYDRTRKNLDRHTNDILAAYMASGT